MTNKEALDVLSLYRNWNTGNTSVSLAFVGKRTNEDDVLDSRRKLILSANAQLSKGESE